MARGAGGTRYRTALRAAPVPAACWAVLAAWCVLIVPVGASATLPLGSSLVGTGLLGTGLAVAAALLAVWALRDGTARAWPFRLSAVTAPAGEERRLHGAYRPQSRPDAPGRPRPRAPGSARRPA